MSKNKNDKYFVYLFLILTIAGCVLACSSIITNDYLKLVVVLLSICVGMYGIMKGLSKPSNTDKSEILD